MGFFSWDCITCGHPLLSEWAVNKINEWMEDVVVIESNGNILKGFYDGYGRVVDREENGERILNQYDTDQKDPEAYHKACWEVSGSPTTFSKSSLGSDDQGFFFGDEHNMEKPTGGSSEPTTETKDGQARQEAG
jgi:hypothetical protein